MNIDLRNLRSFVAVASAGSISRAAESLHIAQPALSVQVKQLEEQLGTALFERHARGVRLTPPGARFLIHALDILKRIDAAYEDVRSSVDEPSGRVSVALPQSVAKYVAVPLVQAVVHQWPGIKLQIIDMNTGYIPEQLLRGHIDIGITFGTEDDARLTYTHLMDEEVVLVISKAQTHKPEMSDKTGMVALHALGTLPIIMPTSAHSLRRRIDDYLKKEHVALNVVAEVNATPELIELTAAGIGSTILALSTVQEHVASGRLAMFSIRRPGFNRPVYACRSNTLTLSIAATKVQELLHKTIKDLVERGVWPTSMTNNTKT